MVKYSRNEGENGERERDKNGKIKVVESREELSLPFGLFNDTCISADYIRKHARGLT